VRILASLIVAASILFSVSSALATVPAEAMPGASAHGAPAAHAAPAGHGEAHDSHAVHGAPPINWMDMGYGDKDINGNKLTNKSEPMAPPTDHNTLFTNFITDLKSGKVSEGKGGAA
jgi:hypothetical protein